MLTRLKVSGFKNLIDVDVRFGPFTCIAGANGVGKSNLFDAIRFLSALSSLPLLEAARSVREGRTADARSLFHRVGDRYEDRMSFEAEMIVPLEGADDLGQEARASITFVRYSVELALRNDDSRSSPGPLELRKEELVHINLGDALKHLLFPHTPQWRRSAVQGRRTAPLISTENEETDRAEIRLHQDRGDESGGGRPAVRLAATLPRTVLQAANAAENRTAVLARREMQSWRLLQLEPSALREPDEFLAPTQIGTDGSHLPATLYHLARRGDQADAEERVEKADEERVYAQVANRLSRLIDDVREVGIDRDERRELLTLLAKGKDGTAHPARALSDGTLRFLALAVIELDPAAQGVLCLEEPENGIHPQRIPAMLELLRDIATNTDEPVGPDNPLRQVIVNTHSPAVVAQVPDDSLVVAELKEAVRNDGQRFSRVRFGCLPGTWRQTRAEKSEDVNVVAKGNLLAYLNPVAGGAVASPISQNGPDDQERRGGRNGKSSSRVRRVVDRPDMQMLLPLPSQDDAE
jgi:predicted ATPase